MGDAQIYLFLGIGAMMILVIVFLAFILSRNQLKQQLFLKEMMNQTASVNNEELNQLKQQLMQDFVLFQTNIVGTLRGDFNQLNESTVNRLVNIETKVNESLLQGFEKTSKAFTSVLEQMARIDETQQNLKSLSANITSLQHVLTDKKTRGTFGEIELYSILESVFGNNEHRFTKQMRLSNDTIADCVLHAPSPLGNIVIDSKFPLENFNRLYDEQNTPQDVAKIKNDFKRDVAKHIKDIKTKYIIPGETAEMAYMFIPAEAVFAEIYGHYDELIQYSYECKVYLVSPTTLMAYITAIKAIYLGQERNDRVVEIQQEFGRLSKEFERFTERFSAVTRDFDKTHRDLQNVSITSDKIMKRFKQIESVELEQISQQHTLVGDEEHGYEED